MQTTAVEFYSEGEPIAGLWRRPDGTAPVRAIVQGPGWLGLKDANLYVRYHEALVAAGFGVLVFDYRGFGDSGGDRGIISPGAQLRDLINAVTYLTTREDVDADAIGVFGTGGTGGGNAVLLAEADDRIRAAVSQVPVADGRDWLHRMRQEHEWLTFLKDLDVDRKERVLTGHGRMVHPREEIMVPTPERRATTVKSDVDGRIPSSVPLACAEEILAYQPIEAAGRLSTPLMIVAVEADATTPTDHAERLYAAARGPKALLMQRHTTHYAAYDRYWEQTTPRIVDWFDRHVRPSSVDVHTSSSPDASVEYLEA
ncbi:prolyl oligopeptidase family serine peptidase [Ruania alkalisoli]|uniref:Prolyl oligopeptidase family serine peptidase n=1 Tax=Ruania alkalisoli TaxID=2779775 RepID=A0A7M1STA7_9MICO|nr:prolyl oligopeptidase family serine peptidase [Ruania alkalisoli]QOR70691.1 prolyl oligopeptidase family serine peptidase [Ruania alkalisoli]